MRVVPFGAVSAQSDVERGAMNLGSRSTSTMVSLAALLTSSGFMCAYSPWRSEVAATRFLATTLCKWTEQNVTVLGAPTGGLRRCPQTTKAVRPHVVLLVDSSMIGYLTASGRNVSLLRRMARAGKIHWIMILREAVYCSGWWIFRKFEERDFHHLPVVNTKKTTLS